jgi:hypothetical protein
MLDNLAKYFDDQTEKGNMRDVDPEVAALSFFSFIFYMNFIYKLNGQDTAVNRGMMLEEFIDIFINGVRASGKRLE